MWVGLGPIQSWPIYWLQWNINLSSIKGSNHTGSGFIWVGGLSEDISTSSSWITNWIKWAYCHQIRYRPAEFRISDSWWLDYDGPNVIVFGSDPLFLWTIDWAHTQPCPTLTYREKKKKENMFFIDALNWFESRRWTGFGKFPNHAGDQQQQDNIKG